MIKRARERLTFANLMSTIAVFIALGGGAYAAIDLVGRNDIKSKHIKNEQVKSKDAKDDGLKAKDIKEETLYLWAVVESDGDLARSGQRNTSSVRDTEGEYKVDFGRDIRNCAYVATTGRSDSQSAAAGAINIRSTGTTDTVQVDTEDLTATDEDRGFHLAVLC